ncbi:MAG: MerR family transcriptional regulator [Bifidobacteriaceae bacterium]|jgi:DNA-binding transcriptional MerR regulator|nr:MerR family transcriptional regulator [Bifidobacteriaceae bacterium]MCI1915363.1 MerR family transcriptional regulator [Bifidobacteriaceae bacterium]
MTEAFETALPAGQEFFSTKQVMELTGVTRDALRYYEQIGVLDNVARDANNYRRYSRSDIHWLDVIRTFRAFGMDISELADTEHRDDPRYALLVLQRRQRAVESEIKHLNSLNGVLLKKIAWWKERRDLLGG